MTEIWLWVTDVGAGTRSGTGVLNGGVIWVSAVLLATIAVPLPMNVGIPKDRVLDEKSVPGDGLVS